MLYEKGIMVRLSSKQSTKLAISYCIGIREPDVTTLAMAKTSQSSTLMN